MASRLQIAIGLVVALLAAASVVPVAAAAGGATAPRISLSIPGSGLAGGSVTASGAVRDAPPGARVRLAARRGGRWVGVARPALRDESFRARLTLPAAGSERLRAELVGAGRVLATSPQRTLRVRVPRQAPPPGTPAPLPTTAAPVPSPPVAPPSHEPAPPSGGELGPPSGEEEPTSPPEEEPPVGPQPYNGPMYWGAWIEGAPWDWSKVTAFEGFAHKKLSLLEFSSPFMDCSSSPCAEESFPLTPFEKIRSEGAIPFFSWSSESIPASAAQPDFQLSDVIAGTYDSYIRRWAEAAARWGHPFFLRFDWEMNGNWFPWGQSINGNLPGEYVTAWQHVRAIFTAAGARNATWVWCPYVDPAGSANIADPASFYPGDSQVDWTCLDGYNWGTAVGRKWHPFSYWFGTTYDRLLEISATKPMLIGETGSSEHGGSKSGWIEDMFSSLPTRFPQLRGLIYFDQQDPPNDWPLETSTAAEEAFAAGVAPSRWRGGVFSGAGTSPIPPPP